MHVFANKVKKLIHGEVKTIKFCIIVDELADATNKEQIAIILRYVDWFGFIRERFFDLVSVPDTTWEHKLLVENLHQ